MRCACSLHNDHAKKVIHFSVVREQASGAVPAERAKSWH